MIFLLTFKMTIKDDRIISGLVIRIPDNHIILDANRYNLTSVQDRQFINTFQTGNDTNQKLLKTVAYADIYICDEVE